MSLLTLPRYSSEISVAAADASVPNWLQALVAGFRRWREERRLVAELSALNDRELADFGLPRTDIARLAKGYRVPALERRTSRR